MKRLKITSVLLSVVMCVTMAFPSFSVIADETSEPAETQTEATEKKQEPTEPKKEEPTEPEKETTAETEKEEPAESVKQEPTESETTPTEPEKEGPKESEKQEPAESKQEEPSETDTKAPEETGTEKIPEATEAPSESVAKTPKNAVSVSNINISTEGILTWNAEEADLFVIKVRNQDYFEDNGTCWDVDAGNGEERRVDLHKMIRHFIKLGEITKAKNNVYYFQIHAYKSDGSGSYTTETFTHTYETTVEPIDNSKFPTVSISDAGVLSWAAVTDAQYYMIHVENQYFGSSIRTSITECSYNLYAAIDKAIEERQIWKEERDGVYAVLITAYDVDDVDLCYWYSGYKYMSNAKPKALPSIPNAKIENGLLTWDDYTGTGFDHYLFRIIDENNRADWYEFKNNKVEIFGKSFPQPVDLKEVITYLLNYKGLDFVTDIRECNKYTVELYAVGKDDMDLLAEFSQTFTYKELNTLSVSGKTAKVKKKKVKKKKQTLSVSKVIKFNNRGQGKLTYRKASGSKKITINGSTGKVTVKKKTKKGTYKVSVWVIAAGDATHSATSKLVRFKIKVK